MSMYTCRCGCAFVLNLGAYGCPNCLGESGPASISDGSDARFMYHTRTVTRQEAENLFPRADTSAPGPVIVRTATLTGEGADHGRQE